MNRDDIIRMAREAGISVYIFATLNDGLDRFAYLVAAAEREACAKVCDEKSDEDGWEGCYADACAEAIRNRGEQ